MSEMGKGNFKEDLMYTIGKGKTHEVRVMITINYILKALKWIQKKFKERS